MIPLLLGVLIAAGAFASVLWSLYRGVTAKTTGLKAAHLILAALVIASMAVISKMWVGLAIPVGSLLAVVGVTTAVIDRAHTAVFPLLAGALGIVLAAGLPF